MKADCKGRTKESIAFPSLVDSTLDIILITSCSKLIGLKSFTAVLSAFFGISIM